MLRFVNIPLLTLLLPIFLLPLTLSSGKPKGVFTPYKEAQFLEIKNVWADSVLKNLSREQKIAQLIIADLDNEWEAKQLIKNQGIGGFNITGNINPSKISRLQSNSNIPLIISIDQNKVKFGRDNIDFPDQMTLGHINDDAKLYYTGQIIGRKLKALGVNLFTGGYANLEAFSPYSYGTNKYQVARQCMQFHEGIENSSILSASGLFPHTQPIVADKKLLDTLYLTPFRKLITNGIPAIIISPGVFKKSPDLEEETIDFKSAENLLRRRLDFEGLVISYLPDSSKEVVAKQAIESINYGANLVLNIKEVQYTIAQIAAAVESGDISTRTLNTRCKKVLLAKEWLFTDRMNNPVPTNYSDEEILKNVIARESFTVLLNREQYLPIANLEDRTFASIHLGANSAQSFKSSLSKYVEFDHFQFENLPEQDSLAQLIAYMAHYKNILVSIDESFSGDSKLNEMFDILGSQSNLSIIGLGKSCKLDWISTTHLKSMAIGPWEGINTQEAAAQILFGALPAKGSLPYPLLGYNHYHGIRYNSNGRLRYTIPEELGMNTYSLRKIDSIANLAVQKKATPGCQVLVVKDGAVVYEKSFGYHTFDKKQKVKNTDIYDLASITKVAASTLSLMRLTDENRFSIEEPLQTYLPYLDSTDKGPLLLGDILTHQAGLYPWIPFYLTLIEGYDDPEVQISSRRRSLEYAVKAGNNFYLKTNYKYRDSLISDSLHDPFTIEVAKNVYMNKWYVDSMFCRIDNSKLNPKKEYRYSDLGYYYIKNIIEDITGDQLNHYTDSVFYGPLGAHRMGYLPLNRYPADEIIPTEEDLIFRKQLLRGYVHDPGAAMLGGVGGHAGLFSNANDLAKLMQMLLNKGQYGNRKYLSNSTIEHFTDCPYWKSGNRRGYGFDKPNPNKKAISPVCKEASGKSFGHTGFTGTITWADPDHNLIYIFLSNRICPDSDNKTIYRLDIRPSIQRAIYESINVKYIED